MTSVPTPTEAAISGTLEEVQRTGKVRCRLCDATLDVSGAEHWGNVFEALAVHGEARDDHLWDDADGWTLAEESEGGSR